MKALKLCERIGGLGSKGVCSVPGPHSTEQLDQRLGSIHHRLASLYHNSYRNQVQEDFSCSYETKYENWNVGRKILLRRWIQFTPENDKNNNNHNNNNFY